MEWMDDKNGRRASIERAWALARLDGLTRYVCCSPGWPIETTKPAFDALLHVREYVVVRRDGHVSYQTRGESQ